MKEHKRSSRECFEKENWNRNECVTDCWVISDGGYSLRREGDVRKVKNR